MIDYQMSAVRLTWGVPSGAPWRFTQQHSEGRSPLAFTEARRVPLQVNCKDKQIIKNLFFPLFQIFALTGNISY